MSDIPEILYFGCLNGAGHFLRSKKRSGEPKTPWGYSLDAGLLVDKDKYYVCDSTPTGKCVVVKKDGWTAIAFWDDKRERMLRKMANWRAAKKRKHEALAATGLLEREPEMERYYPLEYAVRRKSNGETHWHDLKSVRQARIALGLILKHCLEDGVPDAGPEAGAP